MLDRYPRATTQTKLKDVFALEVLQFFYKVGMVKWRRQQWTLKYRFWDQQNFRFFDIVTPETQNLQNFGSN